MAVREDVKDELRYRNKLLILLLNAYVVITPTSTAQQNIFYRFCLLVLALCGSTMISTFRRTKLTLERCQRQKTQSTSTFYCRKTLNQQVPHCYLLEVHTTSTYVSASKRQGQLYNFSNTSLFVTSQQNRHKDQLQTRKAASEYNLQALNMSLTFSNCET